MGQGHVVASPAGAPRRALRLVRPGERPPAAAGTARGSRAVLGMLVFLGSEVVLFATLIVAYLVLRAGGAAWPPPDQPRLPVLFTGLNTLVLLSSAATMVAALRAVRRRDMAACRRWLAGTVALGAAFLVAQGGEWVRLIGFGLRASSSIYGGMFYTLIGVHALHVAAAVGLLAVVVWRGRGRPYGRARHVDVAVAHLYWLFVVAVWPLLYVLVYLV